MKYDHHVSPRLVGRGRDINEYNEMSSDELKRTDFLYQPYYCEENIWHLCRNEPLKNSHVIFIASRGDSFPMLNQRVMKDPLIPILWDYHVILLVHSETDQILDFL